MKTKEQIREEVRRELEIERIKAEIAKQLNQPGQFKTKKR